MRHFPDGQLIVEDGHTPIGQIGFDIVECKRKRIGYVNLFYIVPEYRNTGLGKQLIQYVEKFFINSNVFEYHLNVATKNERALEVYKKNGMVKIKEENNKFRMKKILSHE
nr:GNAT family N-acetyltransferase [Aquibacillus sediminis]